MSTEPVNQPSWKDWAKRADIKNLPSQRKFSWLIEKNPEELVRILHFHLTAAKGSKLIKQEESARLFISYVKNSESKDGTGKALKNKIFMKLPPAQRAGIIDALRALGENKLANSLLSGLEISKYDKNRNGIIDHNDLTRAGILWPSQLDQDGNGYLDHAEMADAMPEKRASIFRDFTRDVADRSENGIVTKSDLGQLQSFQKTDPALKSRIEPVRMLSQKEYFAGIIQKAKKGEAIKFSYFLFPDKDSIKDPGKDPYYGKLMDVMRNQKQWKLTGIERPKSSVISNRDVLKKKESIPYAVLNYRLTLNTSKYPELRRLTGRNKIVFEMKIKYYTNTLSAYNKVFEDLENEDILGVTVQGHRIKQMKERLAGKRYPGRRTPIAYFQNTCQSHEYGTLPVLLAYKKVYAPVGTHSSTFPAPELNVSFINDIVDTVKIGTPAFKFNGEKAAEIYTKANKFPGHHYKDSPRVVIGKKIDSEIASREADPQDIL